jgi:hypothetical protein
VVKRILIGVLLAPMLLLAGLGGASAKDAITRLRLCGASGCVTVRDMTTLQILMTYIGAATAQSPSPAPYFTFAPIPTRQWPTSYPRYVYVPRATLVRVRYPPSPATWATVGEAAPVLQQLTAGMRAYAAPSAWHAVAVTPQAISQRLLPQTGVTTASCAEAIYTTRANTPPKPVHAIQIGSAVFNSLADLTSRGGIVKPSRRLPFYTVKSPLTILARPGRGVVITLVGGAKNAALVYNRRWQQRLAGWHYDFSQVPRSIRLPLCRGTETKLPLNTQYAGGFLLSKPGCITIQVRVIGETRTHRAHVPIGELHC